MSIDQLVSPIYEKIHPFHAGKPGQIVEGQIAWVPTLIQYPQPTIIDFERATVNTHDQVKLDVRPMKGNDYDRAKTNNRPVPSMPISTTEEYVINRAKKRPCILIAKTALPHLQSETERLSESKKHLLVEDCIFLPIYSTFTADNMSGFPQRLVYRIKHFQYTHLVYLPDQPVMANLESKIKLHEGIIRLDRVFSCAATVPAVTLTDLGVHKDYLNLIRFHLKEYFAKETEPILTEYRQLLDTVFDPKLG